MKRKRFDSSFSWDLVFPDNPNSLGYLGDAWMEKGPFCYLFTMDNQVYFFDDQSYKASITSYDYYDFCEFGVNHDFNLAYIGTESGIRVVTLAPGREYATQAYLKLVDLCDQIVANREMIVTISGCCDFLTFFSSSGERIWEICHNDVSEYFSQVAVNSRRVLVQYEQKEKPCLGLFSSDGELESVLDRKPFAKRIRMSEDYFYVLENFAISQFKFDGSFVKSFSPKYYIDDFAMDPKGNFYVRSEDVIHVYENENLF